MKHSHSSSRRDFLKLSANLAALGLMGLGASRPAGAATASDYKALVCIYLAGGNDGNNLIVPLDSARYAYQTLRGSLALGLNKLCPAIADANKNPYALHYGLPELNAWYGAGNLAAVLNTGVLDQPLTRAQYLQGLNVPTSLFSHSDQTVQMQAGQSTALGTGWGGRLLDTFSAAHDNLAAVSVSSPALLLQGQTLSGNVVTPGTDMSLSGMNPWPASAAAARRQALNQILGLDGGNVVRVAANSIMNNGLQLADALSEFGCTLQSNGGGSDHGWGSHHIVLGGAVKGGIYGQYPALALNGPDDANGRGVWIPTVAITQFGASDAELAVALPNLPSFPNWNLGFMG